MTDLLTQSLSPRIKTVLYNAFLSVMITGMSYAETSFIALSFSIGLITFMSLMHFEYLSNEASMRRRDFLLLDERMNSIQHMLYNHTHKLPEDET